jgi:3',5'-cyclic AMP phosphodiesterase CpdA
MAAFLAKFPLVLVIMVWDNIYCGSGSPDDLKRKFEEPYASLLDAKVKFYAALGNHDNPTTASYKNWNMGGKRFYTFSVGTAGGEPGEDTNVRFFVLDTNYMDKVQLDWLESELAKSKSEWKIPYFHHPLYSSGRKHGSNLDLRSQLEPLFVKYGVKVVFAGHDHFYERTKPQQGIHHFVVGAGGSLRKGGIDRRTGLTEVGFDTDYSFMLVEISGREMSFQALSRTGKTVDAGVIALPTPAGAETPAPPN